MNYRVEEERVLRTPGASFNPRPARICRLYLEQVKRAPAAQLIAALLVTVHQGDIAALGAELPNLPEVKEALVLQQAVSRYDHAQCPIALRRDAEILLLALALDRVRHLHMTALDAAQKLKEIHELQEGLLASLRLAKDTRLYVLVLAACERALSTIEPNTAELTGQRPLS